MTIELIVGESQGFFSQLAECLLFGKTREILETVDEISRETSAQDNLDFLVQVEPFGQLLIIEFVTKWRELKP